MRSRHLAFLALVATAIIWGVALPLMKVNLETIPPFSLAFARFFIASFLALIFLKVPGVSLRDFLHIAFFSFFGITLHIGLFLSGLANSTGIDATFILALSPVVTSLLATLTIHEKITILHKMGIALAFAGTFLYISYPYAVNHESLSVNFIGDLLILLAVLSGSIYIIGSKKLFEIYPPSSISTISFVVGAISFLPLSLLEFSKNPGWVNSLTTFNFVSVIFLGVFASFLAYTLLEWGLSYVAVHVNEAISYLSAVISIYLSYTFLGEALNPTFLVSVIFVAIGIYLVTRYKPKTHLPYHQRVHKI